MQAPAEVPGTGSAGFQQSVPAAFAAGAVPAVRQGYRPGMPAWAPSKASGRSLLRKSPPTDLREPATKRPAQRKAGEKSSARAVVPIPWASVRRAPAMPPPPEALRNGPAAPGPTGFLFPAGGRQVRPAGHCAGVPPVTQRVRPGKGPVRHGPAARCGWQPLPGVPGFPAKPGPAPLPTAAAGWSEAVGFRVWALAPDCPSGLRKRKRRALFPGSGGVRPPARGPAAG